MEWMMEGVGMLRQLILELYGSPPPSNHSIHLQPLRSLSISHFSVWFCCQSIWFLDVSLLLTKICFRFCLCFWIRLRIFRLVYGIFVVNVYLFKWKGIFMLILRFSLYSFLLLFWRGKFDLIQCVLWSSEYLKLKSMVAKLDLLCTG